MRISDWSSDVCSSDLPVDVSIAEDSDDETAPKDRHCGTHWARVHGNAGLGELSVEPQEVPIGPSGHEIETSKSGQARRNDCNALVRASSTARADRTSVAWGKSVAVRVDIGGA